MKKKKKKKKCHYTINGFRGTSTPTYWSRCSNSLEWLQETCEEVNLPSEQRNKVDTPIKYMRVSTFF